MNHTTPVIELDRPNVSGESLEALSESSDSWLRRAVDRVRDEAASDPAASVAAFNSSL